MSLSVFHKFLKKSATSASHISSTSKYVSSLSVNIFNSFHQIVVDGHSLLLSELLLHSQLWKRKR